MEKPTLSDSAMFYLGEARRWAKFISIIGFIGVGMLALSGFFVGFIMDAASSFSHQPMPFPTGMFTTFYIIMAIIYFFPVYYLFKFSEDLKAALEMGQEEQLTSAFRWLKSHYKYMGILFIIFVALGVLGFFASILAGIFGFFATSGF
jgi:hypothetical protein